MTDGPSTREIAIDVVSDVVCPWCLIGVERLDQALVALPDVAATIRFHPFLLDPTTPEEGEDLRARLERKYRIPASAMFARVEAAARESGIPLNFTKVTRSVSTVRAHTLIRLASDLATQGALKRALLRGYFLEGLDVGRPDVLVALGARHGLAPERIRTALGDPQELEVTRRLAAQPAEQGVTGVPFFVFDERLAVSGAQPVETLTKVIEKALALRSAEVE